MLRRKTLELSLTKCDGIVKRCGSVSLAGMKQIAEKLYEFAEVIQKNGNHTIFGSEGDILEWYIHASLLEQSWKVY